MVELHQLQDEHLAYGLQAATRLLRAQALRQYSLVLLIAIMSLIMIVLLVLLTPLVFLKRVTRLLDRRIRTMMSLLLLVPDYAYMRNRTIVSMVADRNRERLSQAYDPER